MEKLTAEVHTLIEEVGELRQDIRDRNEATRNRTRVTALVLVVLAFVSWKALDASSDAQRNGNALEVLVEENRALIEQVEADRDRVVELACQNRNSGQRTVRDSFALVLDMIVAGSQTQPPRPETLALVDRINDELAKTPDRDCNGDGAITDDDYLMEIHGA